MVFRTVLRNYSLCTCCNGYL